MAVLTLDLENMRHLDGGRLELSLNQELRKVALDLDDRPGDNRVRNVILKMAIKPICDDTGQLETVAVQFDCDSKFPSKKTKVYSMKCRRTNRGPTFVFDEDSLDDANQPSLPLDPKE